MFPTIVCTNSGWKIKGSPTLHPYDSGSGTRLDPWVLDGASIPEKAGQR